MIDPKVKEILEGVNSTPYGRALKEFFEDEIREHSDLEKIESWDETLGRKYYVKTLRKLMTLMKMETPKGSHKSYE